jgi:glycine/D-amino acid oxidase-like deaminating enzyme
MMAFDSRHTPQLAAGTAQWGIPKGERRSSRPFGRERDDIPRSRSKFDYLIIGNAILGLTTAYRLTQADPQASIGIIGPANRTGSATMAAGAMLGLFGEVTTAHETSQYDQANFQLAYHAQTLWPDFIADLNTQLKSEDAVRIHPHGTFILLNTQDTDHDDTVAYQAILRALHTHQEPHTTVAPQDIPGLHPEVAAHTTTSVYLPGERSINPRAVVRALETVLTQHPQVTQLNHTAIQLRTKTTDQTAMTGVTLDNGDQLHAEQVILAAGVGCQDLIDTLPLPAGRIPPILSGDGIALLLDQQPLGTQQIQHVIRTPNRTGACSLHLVPDVTRAHHVYLGAGNHMQWRTQSGTSLHHATGLMNTGLREIGTHLGEARLLRLNQGGRPITIDGYPLYGACPSIRGLWLLTGTGRDGFQRSPLLSLHLANQLTGTTPRSTAEQATHAIFETFAPERLPIQTCHQADTIQQPETTALYTQLETELTLPMTTLLPILQGHWPADRVKHYLDAASQAHAT